MKILKIFTIGLLTGVLFGGGLVASAMVYEKFTGTPEEYNGINISNELEDSELLGITRSTKRVDEYFFVNSDNLTIKNSAWGIIPYSNDSVDLGSPTNSWQDIYASGTIYGSVTSLAGSPTSTITESVYIGSGTPDAALSQDGSLYATDGINSGGNIFMNGRLIGSRGIGDIDTYLAIESNDQIDFVAGDILFLTADEGSSDELIVNNSSNDVDFRIEGNTDDSLFITNALTDRVGISTAFPSELLTVYGGNIAIGDGTTTSTIKAGTDDGVSSTSTISGSLYLGSGVSTKQLAQDGALFATNGAEFDGTVYFDGAGGAIHADGRYSYYGNGNDSSIGYNVVQTPDSFHLGVGVDSNSLLIVQKPDATTDFAHPFQNDPTIFIHSSSTVNTALFGKLNYNELSLTNFDATATSSILADYGGPIWQSNDYGSASNTPLASDYWIHMTSVSTSTITLPTLACIDNKQYEIIDISGTAGRGGPKYIETEGAETISGEAYQLISGDYNSVSVKCYNSNWYIH